MKKEIVLEKSGGRNLQLYAEVGKFFSPDGILDEDIFKTFLTEKLKDFRKKFDSEDRFVEAATDWIYNYMSQLLDYLNDKGLSRASAQILKITAKESTRFGKNFSQDTHGFTVVKKFPFSRLITPLLKKVFIISLYFISYSRLK